MGTPAEVRSSLTATPSGFTLALYLVASLTACGDTSTGPGPDDDVLLGPVTVLDLVGDKDGFGMGLAAGVDWDGGWFDNRGPSDPTFTDVHPTMEAFSYTHQYIAEAPTAVDSASLTLFTLGIQDGGMDVVGSNTEILMFVDDIEVPGVFDETNQFRHNGEAWVATTGVITISLPPATYGLLIDGSATVRVSIHQLGSAPGVDAIAIDYSELVIHGIGPI